MRHVKSGGGGGGADSKTRACVEGKKFWTRVLSAAAWSQSGIETFKPWKHLTVMNRAAPLVELKGTRRVPNGVAHGRTPGDERRNQYEIIARNWKVPLRGERVRSTSAKEGARRAGSALPRDDWEGAAQRSGHSAKLENCFGRARAGPLLRLTSDRGLGPAPKGRPSAHVFCRPSFAAVLRTKGPCTLPADWELGSQVARTVAEGPCHIRTRLLSSSAVIM